MIEQDEIRNLVAKLGGPAHLARVLGVKAQGNVSAWGVRGVIPWKFRAKVKALADKSGIRLTKIQKQALTLVYESAA